MKLLRFSIIISHTPLKSEQTPLTLNTAVYSSILFTGGEGSRFLSAFVLITLGVMVFDTSSVGRACLVIILTEHC